MGLRLCTACSRLHGGADLAHELQLRVWMQVCYCSGDTGCHSDCDFFDREQPIKIVDTPILGPIKDPGNIRAVSLVPSTHRIR